MKALVHHLVRSAAHKRGEAPALVYKDDVASYGDVWGATAAVGKGLCALGISPRQRVAVYLEKRIEAVVAMFGAAAARAVFVPVNPLLRPHQVAYILRDCAVSALVTSSARLGSLMDELEACPDLRTLIVVGDEPAADRAGRGGVIGWDELISIADDTARGTTESGVDSDVAAILYTSGSTGQPKGVVLSHRNLVVGAESVSHYIGNTPEDRILALLPLSFDAGLSQVTSGFQAGATVVLMNFLLARDVVRLCVQEGITGLTCIPPLWIKLVGERWPPEAGERLRYFANTGGHMPRPLLAALRETFPRARPFLMYGLTEAFRSTYLDPDEVDARPDSIGKAIPNAEVLVVDDEGRECGPGEVGELVHRGPLVSLGYWNAPELTAERFRDAPGRPGEVAAPELAVWSGDLVRRDDEGFIYFVGRRDDMIKTSGYRVSPSEVEEIAFQTGLVREVAAVGVPDDELGQTITLLVVGAPDEPLDVDRLAQECRRRLPTYMVPRAILERGPLPRNPNGKIDRARLRDEIIQRGGQS